MNLKIKIIFLCLISAMSLAASQQGASWFKTRVSPLDAASQSSSSQPGTPLTQPRTPVTPHSPLKKIASFLRFSSQATWQEKLAAEIVQDPRILQDPRIQYSKTSDNDMKIVGRFLVDETCWQVMDAPQCVSNWEFSIQIQQLQNGEYGLTIQNPNVHYIQNVYKQLVPGQRWNSNTNRTELVNHVTSLIRFLNPLNPGYGE